MNLTERLDKHLQNIREGIVIDFQKLYKVLPEKSSSYMAKTIYDFFFKPLEKNIEASKYINYLEHLNKKSNYFEMIKNQYLDDIRIIKRLKYEDKMVYDYLVKKFGPLSKDTIYNWWYDYFIEDSQMPEPSARWFEGGLDQELDRIIGRMGGGDRSAINTLIDLFWDRVDRLEDNEAQQKTLIKQLYK